MIVPLTRLVGVTIRYRSPHVIPTLYLSTSNLIWSWWHGKYDSCYLFVILRFISYWTIYCGFVIYANLTGSNKLWETSILFRSFKVNIDRLRKLRKRNEILSALIPMNEFDAGTHCVENNDSLHWLYSLTNLAQHVSMSPAWSSGQEGGKKPHIYCFLRVSGSIFCSPSRKASSHLTKVRKLFMFFEFKFVILK